MWTEGEETFGRVVVKGEKATIYYSEKYPDREAEEYELRHIGPYSVLMIAPASMPMGLIFFKTEDGFIMPPLSGDEFTFFAKAAE